MSPLEFFHTLAEIQASPSQPNAPAKSAEVLSFTDSKRKKRSEIALAVDNHSLGIYDYGGQVKTSTLDLPEDGSAVVHLETVATHHTGSEVTTIDVLCVYGDGTLRCYDEALTHEKWSTRRTSTHDDDQKTSELRVVHVSTITVQQARQTILKSREDVLSHLNAGQDTYTSNLLLLITRSCGGPLTSRIWAIKDTRVAETQALLSASRCTEELTSFTMPEPMDVQGMEASFRLHTSDGSLYQGTAGKLCIYNLTTVVPTLTQAMNFPNAKGPMSYVRVSSDIVAAIAPDTLVFFDTRFSSIQATYALPTAKQTRDNFPKVYQAKSPYFGTAGSQMVTYHSPSSSVILLLGRSLIAVDLSALPRFTASNTGSRKRKHKELLIDAIGRGSISVEQSPLSQQNPHLTPAIGHVSNPYQSPPEWDVQRRKLDALLAGDGVQAWDQLMVSTLEVTGTSAGSDFAVTHPPNFKVDYVFSKMFLTIPLERKKQRQDGNFFSGLQMNFFPQRTWHCLVHRGLVTVERIEDSLKRLGRIEYNHGIRETGLMQALADYHKTLDSLSSILHSCCSLKVSEIIHALKVAIAKTSTNKSSACMKLLTQGGDNELLSSSANRMRLTDSGSDIDSQQTSDQVDNLEALLNVIINRCNACSATLVTKALRAQLSRTELRNVINLLRVKLARNGWLQLYTENEPSPGPHDHYNNKQVSSIGKVLNCAIDSLGTGGWLLIDEVVDGAEEGTLETISYMRNEIAAAVAGVEEATFLQGILGELLLCGKTALNLQNSRIPSTVEWTGQKSALPLGLKLDHNVSLLKVGAGGELQKRSRRDIGKLKSRKVPEYSFERIAV
ncbi:MAG: hypothetical protein Q9207_000983 [Kuettlingeria erythrocarpa]